jgi:hypothetical protein
LRALRTIPATPDHLSMRRHSTIKLAAVAALAIAAAAQTHDTTPPVLTALTVSPATLDCSEASCSTTITWSATDDLSGVLGLTVAATSPASSGQPTRNQAGLSSNQRQTATCSVTTATVITGAACGLNLPQYAAAGAWTFTATITDAAGNVRIYAAADLAAAGLTNQVAVE